MTDPQMKHLDLFSGIGGFALAARNVGWETVGFCENEPFCQKVLKKHWPDVPIYDDARTLDGRAVGPVDLISGGYPCQPFSLAGERRGQDDDRHLWPSFARLISELRPSWVVGENVAGHISMGLDAVLSDLEGLGYTWEAFVIPAVAVDAKHRRDRVWIVAHSSSVGYGRLQPISERGSGDPAGIGDDGEAEPMADSLSLRESQSQGCKRDEWRRTGDGRQDVPDSSREGLPRQWKPSGGEQAYTEFGVPSRWEPEPGICRVAHGVPNRSHRLRALGNAIVPQVAEMIFRAIQQVER